MNFFLIFSFLTVNLALGEQLSREACSHDNCLRAFIGAGNDAIAFCKLYTPGSIIPAFAANCNGNAARVSSACTCIYSTQLPTSTSSPLKHTTSFSTSQVTTGNTSSSFGTVTSTISATSTTTLIIATTDTACLCTAWAQISPAVASCMDITLDNIAAPASSAIILTKLKTGASITFSGITSFGFTNSSQFKPIQIAGSNVTIVGAPGSIIDGGGPQYWDGLGSNGGLPKPGQFMKVQITNHSIMRDLYIQNTPSHGINIAGVLDSTIENIVFNNSIGDAPNPISNGLSAAHNTDAFDVGNSINLVLQNIKVWNQDDCVVVSDSTNITVRNAFCSGGHGLSIAGGGSGVGHNISNILFTESIVTNSSNALRIKTDYNATGSVVNVTYSNIAVSNIKTFGIDIEQDYLNGGPSGIATSGVIVENIKFKNITGWVVPAARDYYVLCGNGSCNSITYENVHITGGKLLSSCNYPWSECPGP